MMMMIGVVLTDLYFCVFISIFVCIEMIQVWSDATYTGKLVLNRGESSQNLIVFTLFRLIWDQTVPNQWKND